MRHVDDLAALGRRIRTRRLALGLSQRDLAFDGCSYAYISRIEAGTRQPTDQVVEELAHRLGTTRRYLKTGHHDPRELGLADAKLELADLTPDELEILDVDIEDATFAAARAAAWRIRKQRLEAARAALDADEADVIGNGAV